MNFSELKRIMKNLVIFFVFAFGLTHIVFMILASFSVVDYKLCIVDHGKQCKWEKK